MDELCRLCYAGGPLVVSVLDETNKMKILACLPVKICREDSLPKLICGGCHSKVESFYQFCLTALDTEKRLLDLIWNRKAEKGNRHRKERKRKKDKIGTPLKSPFKTKFLQVKENATFDDKPSDILEDDKALSEIIGIKREDVEACIGGEYSEYKLLGEELKIETVEDEKKTDSTDYDNFVDTNLCEVSDYGDETFTVKKRTKKSTRKKLNTAKSGKSRLKEKSSKRDEEDGSVVPQDAKGGWQDAEGDANVDNAQEDSSKEYDCCICFYKCEGKAKMLAHYSRHNKASSRYYNHPTKATNENGVAIEIFECNLCKSVFKNRKEFLAHYTMHRNNNGYRCSLCDKAYSTATEILKHGSTHGYEDVHKEYDGDKPKTLKLDPSEMRFLCELCDAKFTFFKSAKDHRVFDHPENSDPFLVRCILCKETFPTYWMIRKHLRSHREKLKSLCTICGKYLSNNHKLNMHLRIHLGFKPFVCSVCSKSFVNSSRLREHERVHSGDRPYRCECGKKFTQRSSLVIHMRSHSGDRPYTCGLCQRGFISRGLLTVHQKMTCI